MSKVHIPFVSTIILSCGISLLCFSANAAEGNALALDGVDDYASVSDNPTLDLGINDGEGFTIEAFFYVPDLSGEGLQTLIYKQNAYALFINLHTNQADQIFFRLWSPGLPAPGYITLFSTPTNISVEWHHVAAMFDNQSAGQDSGAIYLDGVRIAFANDIAFTPGIGNSSSAVNIGAYAGINPFNGCIDEVRLSDAVRYSGTSYTVPTPPFPSDSNTRALWHFNDALGSTSFADSSTNGNTLTGINGARSGLPCGSDTTRPTVISINRQNPTGQVTTASSVVYRATFSEHVNNVSSVDFTLVDISGTVSGESITSVSASSGTNIDVTVNTGTSGNGDLRLDVIVPGAAINDDSGNALVTSFITGQIYSISHPALTVLDVVDVTPDPHATPVTNVDVVFSVQIDPFTFTYQDVTLTRDGQPVILDSRVTSGFVSGTTYRIDGLDPFTVQAGTYILTVNASGITDVAGNPGAGSASDTWLAKAILVVTNTLDSGPGSLRQAILESNSHPGPDEIHFNIPGAGVHTIELLSQLPDVSGEVVIDGYTQPGATANTLSNGNNAVLLIQLDGLAITDPPQNGLHITAGNSVVRGLMMIGFRDAAIYLDSQGLNIVEGNFIGVHDTATSPRIGNNAGILVYGSPFNRIGGTMPSARNIISWNWNGVTIAASRSVGNIIQGNYIGTDASGTMRIGTLNMGVEITGDASGNIVGGPDPGAGNLISASHNLAIDVSYGAQDAIIQGNLIGTDVTGSRPLGNDSDAINILTTTGVQVGGTAGGAGNVIAFNGGVGVAVCNGGRNPILANAIFSNGGPGIKFCDIGGNNRQSHPIVLSALSCLEKAILQGSLSSRANAQFRIEFFSNCACDSSGYGEGEHFLGSTTVMTDGAGNVTFEVTLHAGIPEGEFVTATATDSNNNTSEFSQCQVVEFLPSVSISDVSLFEGDGGLQNASFVCSLSVSSIRTVTVLYATADGTATFADNDYVSTNSTITFAPGETNKTISISVVGDTKVEPDETFWVNLSSATNAAIARTRGTGTIRDDDFILPRLTISLVTNTVRIFWPRDAEGFGLEFAESLSSAISWSQVTNAPVTVGDQKMVTLNNEGRNKFLRLAKP